MSGKLCDITEFFKGCVGEGPLVFSQEHRCGIRARLELLNAVETCFKTTIICMEISISEFVIIFEE